MFFCLLLCSSVLLWDSSLRNKKVSFRIKCRLLHPGSDEKINEDTNAGSRCIKL